MSSMQAKSEKSLDDSLTNIQWLCGLESSKLLHSQRTSRQGPTGQDIQPNIPPSSPNPHPKPPYSYATMILLAINSTEDKKMTLQDIYKWIEHTYPYYKKCKKAWKNSIRHNLSLHSFFLKEKRPVDLPGKGSYWSISPEGKKNIMREVMKHAQPVIQNPIIQNGLTGRNLRPILPKPLENGQQGPSGCDGVKLIQKMPGVCSLVNGNNIMPVVILPTNVYMELAAKIANNRKGGSSFSVTQRPNATIEVQEGSGVSSKQCIEVKTESQTDAAMNVPLVSMNELMNEILSNTNFSKVLDTIKTESRGNSIKSQENETGEKASVVKRRIKKEESELDSGPLPKKIKTELSGENCIYKKPNLPCPVLHSLSHQSRSPLKDKTQPTLAAMNCGSYNDSFNLLEKDFKFQDLNALGLSPVQQLRTPKGPGISKKTSTPVGSSPLNSNTFRSGLTPLKYDSDSGFFTPLKDSDFDFLLSPNQMGFGLTPVRVNVEENTPQRCRKSLRLGAVQEEGDGNELLSWM